MIKGLQSISQKFNITLLSRNLFSTSENLTNRKQQVLIKPYTIPSKDMILSLSPIKGKYGNKSDYISVVKNGCMLLEFIPQKISEDSNKRYEMEWQNKKVYALSVGQLGQILSITDQALATKDIDINIQYTMQSNLSKSLQIKKPLEEDNLNISIEYNGQGYENDIFKIDVSLANFLVLRELCNFSLPYLLGWQALESYEFAEKDARDERI